ncbi:MAG: TA system VapC family ribonuclease toxin [Sporichthyaceae bacterium]
MLLDVNVLLYAEDDTSPFHADAHRWLTEALNGDARVGLPWHSLLGFVRIRTNPRAAGAPLTGDLAWRQVEEWLAAPAAWIPEPSDRHLAVVGALICKYHLSAKAIPDAHLAALALEHGVPVASTDTGFARFTEIRWVNPLR